MGSSGSGVISWIVIFMAALSLFSMLCMLQIHRIVQVELYSFGLRFSNLWALPYSSMAKLVFLFGWLNIIAAIGVHMYALAFKREEVKQLVTEVEAELAKKESSVPVNETAVREATTVENQPVQPVEKEPEPPIVVGVTPEELKQEA